MSATLPQVLLHSETTPNPRKSCRDNATIPISCATQERAALLGMQAWGCSDKDRADTKLELTQSQPFLHLTSVTNELSSSLPLTDHLICRKMDAGLMNQGEYRTDSPAFFARITHWGWSRRVIISSHHIYCLLPTW